MTAEIIDFDKELGLDQPAKKVPTKKIRIFGREWDVQCDLNTFAVAKMTTGDIGTIANFINNAVVPDQRQDFATAMSGVTDFDQDKLLKLLTRLIEVAGERPTPRPSVSRSTGTKRTSAPKSTVV